MPPAHQVHVSQVAEQEQSRAERLATQLPDHWMAHIFRVMLAMEMHDVEIALQGIQVTALLKPAA